MPTGEIFRASDGDWHWRLRADNGQIIASGAEGYTELNDAREAVDRARAAMAQEWSPEVLDPQL